MKLLTFFIIIFLNIAGLHGQSVYTIQTSDMGIKGTSTFHDWELKATRIRGTCEMNCEGQMIKEIKSFYLEIPVKSLKSTEGSSMMDDKVYSALKSTSNQNIIFQFEKINSMSPNGNGWDVNVQGTFAIAGVSLRDNMNVHATLEPDGTITFIGSKKIRMKDFNVEPPKAFLGALTTGNEVVISFNINLAKNLIISSK
ncbi:MAG TPA: hypothetical protein VE978_27970 [Chitinophagales bacterium]|nr:hypothetical protein [Chitinophagales bacterium]